MKTAISLPDAVFQSAERLARQTNRSRSQLYADALKEYLTRHTPDEVTAAMNATIACVGEPGPNQFGRRAARRVFERSSR